MTTQEQSIAARAIRAFRTRGLFGLLRQVWVRFWMFFVGTGPTGRFAYWLATWFVPPHYSRQSLRYMNPKGFVAPSASLYGKDVRLGSHVFIGDQTVLYQNEDGGPIHLGADATIHRGTIIETSFGGSVTIGERSSFQSHCFLSAALGSIRIGADVHIAPYCAFYPHNHGMAVGQAMHSQPLAVKGDIVVEDGAWFGHGVTVLSGVRIGKGAVIGAGSTVAGDVPDGGIAWGVPAKVIMKRKNPVDAPPSKETVACEGNTTGKDGAS
jgi:acetyltransferase-like isoleucine patch superfamily enzyme